MKKNKIIIVGYGSIGKRHSKNIKKISNHQIVLFREINKKNTDGYEEIYNYEDILKLDPLFVLICNPTKYHYEILKFCVKNNLNFLCEKPLVSSIKQYKSIKKISNLYKGIGRVAYNLRYHPIIIKIKELMLKKEIGQIIYSRFFVGQYLPDWRKNTNYLINYSAHNNLGGGVILDLSHEIDIAEYLFGNPNKNPISLTEKISNVTIDSEDISEIIYKTNSNVFVSIHMNYLIREKTRKIFMFGTNGSINADLISGEIEISKNKNKKKLKRKINFNINDMYIKLIEDYIATINNNKNNNKKLPSINDSSSLLERLFYLKNQYGKK